MQQTNTQNGVKEIDVTGGFRIVQTDVKVKNAVFEDEIVKRPVFVDEVVKVPVGYEEAVAKMGDMLFERVMNSIESVLADKIEKRVHALVDDITSKLQNTKIKEELIVNVKPVEVEKPVYKDKVFEVPVVNYVDKEVINPVLKDVEVMNPILIDKPVMNAVITDVQVTNALIKDVPVERAIIREKVIEVYHKTCFDAKGNLLTE